MSLYRSCSIQQVLGRLSRGTRVQDASYLEDAKEWIPEAMGYMRTRVELVSRFKDAEVDFHICDMPVGTLQVTSVVDKHHGHRIKENSSGQRPAGAPRRRHHGDENARLGSTNAFLTVPEQRVVGEGDEQGLIYQSTAIPLESNIDGRHHHRHEWYRVEMDHLLFSHPDGPVTIYTKGIPLDDNELPLIPDNEFYKQALYWYVRASMIAAGWKDQALTWDKCNANWETYAARAMGQIRYPSVASMEMKVDALQRMFLPRDYWSRQFEITEGEKYYGDEYWDGQPTPYI